jgi:hypothetical protein
MRKLAIPLAVGTALLLAGSALAALPAKGNFTGKTSTHSQNGFYDLVTFSAAGGGRSLRNFQFGTLGCMSSGFFPVGVDPFAQPYTQGTIASIPVTAKGTILVTAKPYFAETDNIKTTVTIKATFTSASAVNGTIAVSQSENGSTCTANTVKFSAGPGTPQSLGYSG